MGEFFYLVKTFLKFARRYGLYPALQRGLFWWKLRIRFKYRFSPTPLNVARKEMELFKYRPLISILMPVFNPPLHYLKAALDSVFSQYYGLWELCVVDDGSRDEVRSFLKRHPKDPRVKLCFHSGNKGISEALNTALSMATGEFIALLDHDDELPPDALFHVVKTLNEEKDLDMIYSDEDKIMDGKYMLPHFKPGWSPEYIMGMMYTCHLGVYRTSLVKEIGGFRKDFEGAQDYDLVLRIGEVTSKIHRIPKVLYHWRVHEASAGCGNFSAKKYAYRNAKKAVEEVLERRGELARVEELSIPGRFLVHYLPRRTHRVSIIIPTRDGGSRLERCLKSIARSTYKDFEVLIVDNGSKEEKTYKVYRSWRDRLPLRVLQLNIDFNFSRLVNCGVAASKGDFMVLLNDDTELISPDDWIQEMLGYAEKDEIGCVGALLLYPDNTIQHGGIFLGVSGDPNTPPVARNAFKDFPASYPGYFDRLRVVSNFSAVTAACMMVEKRLWEKVGGFDESLRASFNDVDFCLKLLDRGYRHVLLPHVKFYHHESETRGYVKSKESRELLIKEAALVRKRWLNYIENDPFFNPNLKYGIGIVI